jgi:acyl-CoA hydrolase|tara:strand:- start:1251 stop:1778 length:528 start_codon:yes stop_codon:yes gene_type:complete
MDGKEKMNKTCKGSWTTMTELILPNDTNNLNNLFGGRLMHWMDIAAAVAAQRHCNNVVVTASVDNISFSQPIDIGNVITLEAFVVRAFTTSMEVFIKVIAEDIPNAKKIQTHTAFFTFVAVDKEGNPLKIPKIEPESLLEKELYKGALRRRQLRLVLAKRMEPKDAHELKSLFID